jgi:subtilisin family serine protease
VYNQGIFPGTEALAIGAEGALAGGRVLSPFAGRIDEAAVYNRALFDAEIAAIYNAGRAGKCGGLPPVILAASQAYGGIRIAWPVSATGFVLQETSSPRGNWTNSSASVVVQGNENVAAIATTGTAKFYRLRK